MRRKPGLAKDLELQMELALGLDVEVGLELGLGLGPRENLAQERLRIGPEEVLGIGHGFELTPGFGVRL